MEDPVMTSDGQSYERVAITKWFEMGRITSPISNEKLNNL
jgi:hypothetical protein